MQEEAHGVALFISAELAGFGKDIEDFFALFKLIKTDVLEIVAADSRNIENKVISEIDITPLRDKRGQVQHLFLKYPFVSDSCLGRYLEIEPGADSGHEKRQANDREDKRSQTDTCRAGGCIFALRTEAAKDHETRHQH